jgi:tRNA threonylcarbamoyladenosine biosynthesis protein TsaB
MVNQLLQKHGVRLRQLDVIAVDTGPGSFTGLRIGVGFAQGLAYASDLPVLGVSSLAALAATCTGGKVLAAIDARMKQVYWGIYNCDAGYLALAGAQLNSPEELTTILSKTVAIEGAESVNDKSCCLTAVGSGWEAYADRLPRSVNGITINVIPHRFPEASQIAVLARNAGIDAVISPLVLAPTYVRNNVTYN